MSGRILVAGGGSTTSVSPHIVRGETWRIFSTDSATRLIRTSVCGGTRRLSS